MLCATAIPHQWPLSPVAPPYQSVHPVYFVPQAKTMDGTQALTGQTLSGEGLAGGTSRYMRDKCKLERNRWIGREHPYPSGINFLGSGREAFHSKLTPWSAQTECYQPSNPVQCSPAYVCQQYQDPYYPHASDHTTDTQTPHLGHKQQPHYIHVTQPNFPSQ